jgi:hypothetical protein
METNEQLKNIALKVLNRSSLKPDNEKSGFATITVLMIISVILTCIRILQECNKTKLSNSTEDKYAIYKEQIKTFSINKGWFTKMRIKKILRKEMKPDDYKKYSLSILIALLDTGEVLTDDEIKVLVEAANV